MIPLIGKIKVCIVPFQVHSMSHLIKIPIFLYREDSDILSSLKHAPGVFSKNLESREQSPTSTLTFVSLKRGVVQWLAWSTSKRKIVRSNPIRTRSLSFYFLSFSRTFLSFFLNFTNNISQLFRKVTDKFFEHYC